VSHPAHAPLHNHHHPFSWKLKQQEDVSRAVIEDDKKVGSEAEMELTTAVWRTLPPNFTISSGPSALQITNEVIPPH